MNDKILIVTEDSSLGAYFHGSLRQAGFYTAWAAGAVKMVEFCQQYTPDLILLDVDSAEPGLWTSVQAVRSIRNLANLPFLGVSNVGAPGTLEKARGYGFCGMMPKSSAISLFSETIHQIMTEIQQNQQTAAPSGLARLIALSSEINRVSSSLKERVAEFGADGPELFGYIAGSGGDIQTKLSRICDSDLACKEIRHDLRNMIGSVTGFSELLLMETTLSADSQKGFTRLRECSREFVELLDKQKAASGA